MMKVCALYAKKLIFKNFEGLDDHYECFFFWQKRKIILNRSMKQCTVLSFPCNYVSMNWFSGLISI